MSESNTSKVNAFNVDYEFETMYRGKGLSSYTDAQLAEIIKQTCTRKQLIAIITKIADDCYTAKIKKEQP